MLVSLVESIVSLPGIGFGAVETLLHNLYSKAAGDYTLFNGPSVA